MNKGQGAQLGTHPGADQKRQITHTHKPTDTHGKGMGTGGNNPESGNTIKRFTIHNKTGPQEMALFYPQSLKGLP